MPNSEAGGEAGEIISGGAGRVGVVGLGAIGWRIASCLIDAGFKVVATDVSPVACERAIDLGVEVVANAAAVGAMAAVVITALPGPEEVTTAVLDGADSLLSSLRPGGVLVDVSTVGAACSRKLSQACAAADVEYVDAPVSGRPPELSMMLGGTDAAVRRIRPVLDAIADRVDHLGPSGSGCAMKLVVQYVGYCHYIATVEGLKLGLAAGLPLGEMTSVLQSSAASSRMTAPAFLSVAGENPPAEWGSVAMIGKDMALVREFTSALSTEPLFLDQLQLIFEQAVGRGWADQPFTAASDVVEPRSNADVE